MESLVFTEEDLKFKIPSGIMLAGPSQSGKSTFLSKLVANYKTMFHPEPAKVVYAYGEYDSRVHMFTKLGAQVVAGIPNDEFIAQAEKPLLLILDDLMLNAKDIYLQDMFTKKAHHQNICVIFVTQNLFDKNAKVARMNSQYIILMRAPNAALHVRTLGTQLFPLQLDYFLDAYKKATSDRFGYLLIDLHPGTHTALRLRTKIFPNDSEPLGVFIPKNYNL